jgi:NADH:ubiquinone oxidoreductase subunit 2 (subunit N)
MLRKIFAYSTISQVSYALFPIFLGNEELTRSAFFHIVSNGISKLALFIIICDVLKTKIPAISSFNGLAKRSLFLSLCLIFFFANIVGVPITLGFFTKVSIILGLFKAKSYLFIFIMLLGAILNFLYFWRIASVMFFKNKADQDGDLIVVSWESKLTLILLLLTSVAFLVFFNNISSTLDVALKQFYLI